ncbi:hypothetical protein J1N35_018837 [Gossypium stocksii]|uniref:PLAC8 family protein n=1 Tax=Gossypium stocksii TaxID=47602 RepID=A0A9D3VRS4_9ROSI|nr:hypothetical protein J1N35_018837 [Gossypium stocksii]
MASPAANRQSITTPNSAQWTTGLFDCFDDSSNCFMTWCCPFITFGRNVEIIDRGKTSPADAARTYYILGSFGFAFCYSYPYRKKLREQFSLKEQPCGDCLVHCCCIQCALCQEHRELINRGLDPTIGWAANVARMIQNEKVAPAVEAGMNRVAP